MAVDCKLNIKTTHRPRQKTLAPAGDNENSADLDFELEKDIGFGSDKASTADIDFEPVLRSDTASAGVIDFEL